MVVIVGNGGGEVQHCADAYTNANALPHKARAICPYDVPADRRGRTRHFNSGQRAITSGWSAGSYDSSNATLRLARHLVNWFAIYYGLKLSRAERWQGKQSKNTLGGNSAVRVGERLLPQSSWWDR